MKIVLFCGGLGMRMRSFSETIPKPMVEVGGKPLVWHVMKYYAHFGHTDFILCLGWGGDYIREYFSTQSNGFCMNAGAVGNQYLDHRLESGEERWRITLCDTGISSSIGERLTAVKPLLENESTFLANYADGLSDLPLSSLIEFHTRNNSIATFVSVRPSQSFHTTEVDETGRVSSITPVSCANVWANGGYFVLSNEIFQNLDAGEDLVDCAFPRLVRRGRCYSMKYEGFWGCVDTYKEMKMLNDMTERGRAPWAVWDRRSHETPSKVH